MQVLMEMLPIFLVLALGFAAARMGIFPVDFIKPASRIVFYLGIPFMVFRSVIKAPVSEMLVITPALLAMAAIIIQALLAIVLALTFMRDPQTSRGRRASWICSQFHGNMAIMGLVVVYYTLGEQWVGAASLILALLMLTHTILVILILTRLGENPDQGSTGWHSLWHNPVMIAVALGLVFALAGIRLPHFLDRTFGILAGMALPLALLIIGAELSQWKLGEGRVHLLTVSIMKLFVLPAIGWSLMLLVGTSPIESTLAVIMLASPCAAVSVILAGQMGGDSRFASAATSFTHAISPLTYFIWMSLVAS